MSKRKWHVGELPAIGQVHRNGWQVHVGRPPIDGLAAVGRPMRPGYDQVAEAAASQGGAWILKKHVATQVAQVVEH